MHFLPLKLDLSMTRMAAILPSFWWWWWRRWWLSLKQVPPSSSSSKKEGKNINFNQERLDVGPYIFEFMALSSLTYMPHIQTLALVKAFLELLGAICNLHGGIGRDYQ